MNEIVKAGLTPKQVSVAELLLTGLSNREIAEKLQVCESTVKSNLRCMFARCKPATPSGEIDGRGKRLLLARQLLCR